jgi:polygalacturonase
MPTRRLFLATAPMLAYSVNVREHGARGDGHNLDTKSLQAAIDACGARGGGITYVPPGRYLTGTLFLRSGVTLHLAMGSVLLGSKDLMHYPETRAKLRSYTDNYTDKSLIYGEDLERTGIEGAGTIDGQGAAFEGPYKRRPFTIRMIGCRGVSIRDVRIQDSPMWVQHYLGCEDVHIAGVRVHSRVNQNNDGIDIDSCARVRIADCDIWSGDDAIVLKATTSRPCRDVVVTNCVISSNCNGLKLGTESNGGFDNIVLSNCTVYDTRLAGIAIESVDGGQLTRVLVSGITMRNVACPLFIRLGGRGRPFEEGQPKAGMGTLRDVSVDGVYATGANVVGCPISGLPGYPIENVYLSNLDFSFAGGGTREQAARSIPEEPEKYPEYRMFGVLPAYGLYLRHVRELRMRDVRLRTEKPDARPAIVREDATDAARTD